MTGIDLGPPQDLDRGNRVLKNLQEGRVPSLGRAGRMLLQMEEDIGGGRGTLVGVGGSVLKGLADASLQLARGAQWLGYGVTDLYRGRVPQGVPEDEAIPGDVLKLLPEETAMRVESRLARAGSVGRPFGEIAGHTISMVGTGGTSAIAKAVSLPGKAVQALGIPGTALGAKMMAKAPQVGRWASMAQQHVPNLVGASTGFGLYNYITAEGGMEERAAAALHGAVAGAGLHVLGEIGRNVDRWVMSSLLSKEEVRNLLLVAKGLKDPKSLSIGKLKKVPGRVLSSAIEGTGFAGMDSQWWSDVIAGSQGDEEAMARALGVWAGGVAGVLAAKYAQPDAYLFFRRTQPDVNTLELRLEADRIRRERAFGKPEPQEPGRREFAEEQKRQSREAAETQKRETAVAEESVQTNPQMKAVSDPLFQSGWEIIPGKETSGPAETVSLELPGAGRITMTEVRSGTASQGPGSGFVLEVPPEVYRAVRGESPEGPSRLQGPAAIEFANDLAAVSMIQRIRGELLFGGEGREAWAGGPWKGEDGRHYTVGIDGKVYSRSAMPEPGESWRKEPDRPLPQSDNRNLEDPQIQRWMQLAQTLRSNTAPNPGLDLIEASLMLAIRGRRSQSLDELLDFLTTPWDPTGRMTNADLMSNILRPENIEPFGMLLGQLSSGHMNAEAARQRLVQLSAPPKLLPYKEETPAEEPKKEEPSKKASEEFVGSRDWGSLPKKERIAGAKEYARLAAEEGVEAAPSAVSKSFGVARTTARDILKRAEKPTEREGERGAILSATEAAAGLKETGERIGRHILNPKRYYRPMTKELRMSGPAGQEIARRGLEAIDLTKQRLGEVAPIVERALSESANVGFVGKANSEARRWAKHVVYDESGRGEANFKSVVEGRGGKAVPEAVQRWAETYAELRHRTGVMAEEAKAVRINKEGQYEFTKASPKEAPIFVRELTPEFFQLMREGGPRLREVLEALSTYGRNQFNAEEVIGRWREGMEKIESKEAFEFHREMPDMFSHYRFRDGRTLQLLETSPYDAIKNMAESAPVRTSVIQAIGQKGIPEDVRKQMELPPGPEALMTALYKEGGRLDVAESFLQAVGGIGADALPAVIPKSLRQIETLRRVAQIIKSAPLDLIEGLATIPQFTGFRDAIIGMAKGGMNWKEIKSYLEQIGAMTIEAAHHLRVEDSGLLGYLTQKLGLPKQIASDAGAVMAGASALHVLKRWDAGNVRGKDILALERMEFDAGEIAALTRGAAEQPLRDRFVRRFVANATGQFLRAERSQMGASSTVNLLFPYNRFFMNRFRQAVEVTSQLSAEIRRYRSDKTTENRERAKEAAGQFLRYVVGASVVGTIGTYLSYLLVDGAVDAFEQAFAEVTTDPAEFALRSANSSWLGGIPRALAGLYLDKNLSFEERVERLSPDLPLGVFFETAMMFSRSGPYKGETVTEAAATLGSRLLPVSKDMDFVASWAGFDVDPEVEGAISAFSRWKRVTGKQSGRGASTVEDEDLARWRAMRDLANVIRSKAMMGTSEIRKDPDVRKAIREALGESTGRGIAGSLRGRKFLADLSPEELVDLSEREGPSVLRRLQAYDDALEAVASTYGKVPRNLERAEADLDLDELLDVATRAAKQKSPKGFAAAFSAIEQVFDARRSARLPEPREEITRLAQVMADHPEVAREFFTPEQQKQFVRIKSPQLVALRIARLLRERLKHGERAPSVEKVEATSPR